MKCADSEGDYGCGTCAMGANVGSQYCVKCSEMECHRDERVDCPKCLWVMPVSQRIAQKLKALGQVMPTAKEMASALHRVGAASRRKS